ncbi:hypothetical protein PybrP1_010678 [[Pythium] brassicae (nom. inval.)]|nr:hypothetical protein PybrP1_010678 [[Pythium] brassicae (nom. inval.)]
MPPPAPAAPEPPDAAPLVDSPARRRRQREISAAYFGPSSTTTDLQFASDDDGGGGAGHHHAFYRRQRSDSDSDSDDGSSGPDDAGRQAEDLASRRRRRKENHAKFQQIAQLADAHRPVDVRAFTRKSSAKLRRRASASAASDADRVLNTELLEAYVAYARSIGREPQIDCKRRGCVQFWAWLFIGVVVGAVMAFFLAHLSLDEVLHLDAFVEENVVVTDDFTYLYLRDEVTFRIRYDIVADTAGDGANNASTFQVLLLYEDDFEAYVAGEPFAYIRAGSTLRTTYASLALTEIENEEEEEVYFVVQPCALARNPGVDYCQTRQLPTPVRSTRKVFKLQPPPPATPTASPTASTAPGVNLALKRLYVNPMPNNCSASGWKAGSYFLIFLPFLLLSLFGLRVFQMLARCESFRANLERKYTSEFAVPENEVDYWQPMPWDRKVPKTRLLGPCCWRKMRRPFEPFYTWWRHENYFTWIFFPYRNERLSRGERALIVFCSLYLTFYVLFVLVMLRDSLGARLSLAASVLIYYVLLMVLPTLGKAVFKEIFKLIFRQRRRYFRLKAAGGDTAGFSFRFAFCLQVLATLLIAVTQLPMFYIWLYRSCAFLKQFLYFGLLAAVTRLSVLGLSLDYAWYLVIKTWGWKDLCPYCTERLVHCDCFNDELLVLSVERVGPKWALIQLLDAALAKHGGYTAQFDQYSAEQLRERWQVLVERAEAHMDKVEKLRAYQAKKRVEQLRRQRHRASFLNAASVLGFSRTTRGVSADAGASGPTVSAAAPAPAPDDAGARRKSPTSDSNTEEDEAPSSDASECADAGCFLREQKILAINSRIMLDRFEKHYDSTIVDVFHSIQRSLSRKRRHARREWRRRRAQRHGDAAPAGSDDDSDSGADAARSAAAAAGDGTRSSSSGGETMWVFDSPQQRLERRELEKQRRKRAFRVLDDYFIETVEPERDAQGNVHFVSTSDHGAASATVGAGAAPAPDSNSGGTRPPANKTLTRRDSKYVQLLSRQKSLPRNEDVVVVVSESAEAAAAAFPHVTVVEEEGESESEREPDGTGAHFSDDESTASPRDALGPSPPAPPSSRAYAVMERKPSIMRQMSASATAFASWVFKLDRDDDVV